MAGQDYSQLYSSSGRVTLGGTSKLVLDVKGLTGSERCVRLTGLLALPFVGAGADSAIGHVLEPTRERALVVCFANAGT